MATALSPLPFRDTSTIYNQDWQERLRSYLVPRESGYWAFDFAKAWTKFQRGVRQELELADLVEHWLDLRQARVLVVGSFLGTEAIAYALRGACVTGVDLDEQALELSRQLGREYGIELDVRAVDATCTSFADASFDYVSCAQVLEHLPPERQSRLLEEIWRVLRPGGLLWLDTPNQHCFMDHHDTGLPFIHWLPRGLKVPLARLLGRAVPGREPAFGNRPVFLHHYVSYPWVQRQLARLGPHEVLSRYRGFADLDHYRAVRERQGRWSRLQSWKLAVYRQLMRIGSPNWFTGIRLMIRKGATPANDLDVETVRRWNTQGLKV